MFGHSMRRRSDDHKGGADGVGDGGCGAGCDDGGGGGGCARCLWSVRRWEQLRPPPLVARLLLWLPVGHCRVLAGGGGGGEGGGCCYCCCGGGGDYG